VIFYGVHSWDLNEFEWRRKSLLEPFTNEEKILVIFHA
jgi:hypothetical protein